MSKIKTWEHQPKSGEEYQGWFASCEINGLVIVEGGFMDAKMARAYIKTVRASK